MLAAATRPLAAALTEWVSANAVSFAVGAAALLVLLLIVGISNLRARQRFRGDVRSVVQAIEELRAGRGRGHTEVADGSRLGLVADAVHRLGVDLHSTWSEAETAAERWRAVTDATLDTAIITTDTDGDIRSFSASASQLTGWDEDEVLARPAAVLFDENAYKDLLPKLSRRSLRTQGVTTRSSMVRRDGSAFQAEVSVRMLMGTSSQPVGFMMLVRDITEQMRMETELRDSERRYRGLVEGLAEGVIIVREGRIVYVNPAAEQLCRRKGPELVGTAWRDRVSTRDVLMVEAALEGLASGGGSETLRCALLGPDGEERAQVRVKVTAVEFAGGPAAMLLVEDETRERLIEEELRRNETRLDAVLEAISDGVLVLSDDPGRMVQLTNRAFAEMFGLRTEELPGASGERLAGLLDGAGEGARRLVEWLERLESPGEGSETLFVEGDPARELLVSVARLTDRGGEKLGRVVVCRDVTEERRSQRELQEQADRLQLSKVELEQSYRKLNDVNSELETRSLELDRLNQELRRLDKMKSDLIGNVSHELQTPLVSIRGYTEMILRERLGPISEEQRKGLSLSLKNIDRLISMIDNLLAFTRTAPGESELELSRFDLGPLMEEVRTLLHDSIAAKRLDVRVSVKGERVVLQADRDRILQVFVNLLSNAVKFSAEGGRIELSAERGSSAHATVSVRDEGAGIPAESLGRIFERHYQVQPAVDGGPSGSGIGLTIVRDILRLHGCTIRVESTEGRGSTFTFTLPLAAQGERAEPEARESPAVSKEEPAAREPEPDAQSDAGSKPTREVAARNARPRLRIIRRYRSEES